MGDDLALNAEQVSGVRVERELPVVWAVAKGSFINKLILVPTASVSGQQPPISPKPFRRRSVGKPPNQRPSSALLRSENSNASAEACAHCDHPVPFHRSPAGGATA